MHEQGCVSVGNECANRNFEKAEGDKGRTYFEKLSKY